MLLCLGFPVGGGEVPVQVMGQRVNLRARPGTNFEVVGQASNQQLLIAKSFGEAWVEICPPEGSHAWAHGDFVEDGRVQASELNVRAGPSLNHSIIGRLPRGTVLSVLGEQGRWLKISAPPSCSYWISLDYVRRVTREAEGPAEPVPGEDPAGGGTAEPAEGAAGTEDGAREHPPPLPLVPLDGQGASARYGGKLRYADYLLGRPSRFRLVDDVNGRSQTVCYVHGNSTQLKELVGRDMTIEGWEYWAREVRLPVLVPKRIVLKRAR